MEDESIDPLEKFWDAVLSRQPKRIRAAVRPLDPPAWAALLAHLKRMSTEDGWSPQQQASALAAVKAMKDLDNPDDVKRET